MKHHFLKALRSAVCFLIVMTMIMSCMSGLVFAVADAQDEIVNLSEGILAVPNSSWNDGNWEIENLTDGCVLAPWPLGEGQTLGWRSGAFATRDVNITIDLDLKQTATVERVELYPRGGGATFPDDYSISLSEDGNTWNEVVSVTDDSTIKNEGRIFSFTPQKARYVKVNVTKLSSEKDGNHRVCTMSEIMVFGKPGEAVVDIQMDKTNFYFTIGEEASIQPTVKGLDVLPNFEYTSSDSTVAAVDANGILHAYKAGETEITIKETNTGYTQKCRVVVGEQMNKMDNILVTVPMWANDLAITEEQFIWLRDADIDAIMAVGHDNSIQHTEKMLDIAQKLWDSDRERNLGVFVHSYLNGVVPSASDEEVIAHAEYYRNTLAFMGYHIEDEPRDPLPYARLERLLKEHDPDSITDINFLPGSVYGTYQDDYYQRLSDYAKLLGDKKSYLSFDNYPFGPSKGHVNENDLFGNFEAVRRAGLENDMPTAFYLQGVGSNHFGYRRPTEGVLRYHIASALSYGFKWVKYFSWYVPGATGTGEDQLFMTAIMDHNAQKTDLYDVAATLNKEVHNVGDILVQLDATEVYHSGKKSTATSTYTKLPSDFFVQPEGDAYAIISLFENKESGKQYLMIVNKDFDNAATMSFKLEGVASLTEIDKTVDDGILTPDYAGGVLTRTFKPGEFALYELPTTEGGYGSDTVITDDNILVGAYSTTDNTVAGDGYCVAYAHDDQNLSTKTKKGWMATSTDGSTVATLNFDMGTVKEMNRLDVYPAGLGSSSGSSFPQNIKLEVSEDGNTWKTVLDVTDIDRPTTEVPVYKFDSASGRYVRITVSAATDVISVGEFALYADDGSIPEPPKTTYTEPTVNKGDNIAFGKRVNVSSAMYDGAWNPQYAVDGVKMTSWPTNQTLGWASTAYKTRDVSDVYLSVDLENTYSIDRVMLYPRGNGGMCFPSSYTVSVSTNNKDWTVVYEITGDEGKGEQGREITFDKIDARYVRVDVTKLGPETDVGGYFAEISEIEIYAAEDIKAPDTGEESTAPGEETTAPDIDIEFPEAYPVSATEPTVIGAVDNAKWYDNDLEPDAAKAALTVAGGFVKEFRYGDVITFAVDIPADGLYEICLNHIWIFAATWDLSVDGEESISVSLEPSTDWNNAFDAYVGDFELAAGTHTFAFTYTKKDSGDHIGALLITPLDVEVPPTQDTTSPDTDETTSPDEGETTVPDNGETTTTPTEETTAPDVTVDETVEAPAPADTTAAPTADATEAPAGETTAAEASGCKSAIGAAAATAALITAAGAVALKKKED